MVNRFDKHFQLQLLNFIPRHEHDENIPQQNKSNIGRDPIVSCRYFLLGGAGYRGSTAGENEEI